MAKKGKWKKRIKKALKLAAIGGAGFLASKALRNRATDLPGNAMANAKRLLTSQSQGALHPYEDPIRHGVVGVKHQPKIWTGNQTMGGGDMWRYPSKKGGRVGVGIAKRGFGRALRGKK